MDLVKFALKNGADDAAVETVKSDITQIKFANSSLSVGQNWSVTRYNVFVAVKNATAATSFYGITKKELEAGIKNLISLAKKSKPSHEYSGLAKGPFRYKKVPGLFDKKAMDYDGADAISAAINASDGKSSAGFFSKGLEERFLQTSGGAEGEERKTFVQMSIRAFQKPDESGHSVSCSRVVKGFDPEKAGKEAGETAKLAKNPVKGTPGKYKIIFAPMAMGNLLSRVGEFSTAFNVDSGFSCFSNKLGKQVASSIVNITDDGKLDGGFNSTLFDDEGVPAASTKIISKGILKTYLHNTSSAKKYKTKTTANAGIIAQRYNNIVLEQGSKTKEKLIEGIDNGLFVTNVWYTRFQSYYDGVFSTIPRDGILVIKNGKINGAIKNVRITENLQNMLMNVTGLSNKLHCVQWWEEISPPVYTPHVLINNVNITLPTM